MPINRELSQYRFWFLDDHTGTRVGSFAVQIRFRISFGARIRRRNRIQTKGVRAGATAPSLFIIFELL